MIYGITLILLSIIAVPSLILSKKPNAQELLDKVAPYQGWIGLVFCFFGVWGVISASIASSVAVSAFPPIKAVNIRARVGSPIRRAMIDILGSNFYFLNSSMLIEVKPSLSR